MNERFIYTIEQRLQHLSRDLKHVEEILLRSSPVRQLLEAEMKFKRYEDEYKRVIQYKLERCESLLPDLSKNNVQNILFILEQKSQYLEFMHKKLMLNNPALQCREGWGQVAVEGKTVMLSALEINQKFIIQDAQTQIEALCLNKL